MLFINNHSSIPVKLKLKSRNEIHIWRISLVIFYWSNKDEKSIRILQEPNTCIRTSIKDACWKNNHAVLKIMMPEICAFLFAFCHLLFSVEIVDSYLSCCCCCRILERDGGRPGMKPANRGWYPSPMYR